MSVAGENRRRRSERRWAVGARPPRRVVAALRCAGVLSVSEIADALGVSPSAATTLVEDPARLGVVDRRMAPEDRRRRQVRLTVAWLPDRARGSGRA